METEKALTPGQERFCVLYTTPDVEGRVRPAYRCYAEAFPRCHSPKWAEAGATQLLKMPAVRARIAELRADVRARYLDERLPFTLLLEKVVEGLEAVKTMIATEHGEIRGRLDVPDAVARERYVRLALELRGDLATEGDGAAAAVGEQIAGIVQGIAARLAGVDSEAAPKGAEPDTEPT